MGRWTDIATWKGNSPNHGSRGGTKIEGFVVHTANGDGDGVVNWIMNPASDISATFVVMKSGKIYQTLDTDLRPWTTGNSNSWTISAECEGFFKEAFTDAQVKALGRILKKANQVYGVDIKHSESTGISGHRQHMSSDCPGDKRYAQLKDVVAAAKGASSAPSKPTTPTQPSKPTTSDWTTKLIMALPTVKRGSKGADAKRAQALLVANGRKLSIDGDFGPASEREAKAFQKAKGLAQDAQIGPKTWTKLLGE